MRKAFSLIEVLLIVAIVAVTFAGVMALTQRILQMENVVKNDFIAEGLLREGAELVRAVRSENVSSSLPFFKDMVAVDPMGMPTPEVYSFAMDWQGVNYVDGIGRDASHIYQISGNRDPRAIVKMPNGPYYQMTGSPDTPFYRYFLVTYVPEGSAETLRYYLNIEVVVYWEERGKGHTSHLNTKLYGE